MQTHTLTNGSAVEIKKVGAFTTLAILDIVIEIVEKSGVAEMFKAFKGFNAKRLDDTKISEIVSSFRHLFNSKNVDAIEKITCMVTDLQPDDLRADGPNAIGLSEVVTILIEAYDYNDFKTEFACLGEKIAPLLGKELEGRGNGNTKKKRSPQTCSTPSQPCMDGVRENLTRSGLLKP